jgi:hypothetical protein
LEDLIVGAVIAGGFALTGSGITAFGNARSAQRTNDAQTAREREARRQQRIEDAYVEIQVYVADCMRHVHMCLNHWADRPEELPPRPQLSDRNRDTARLHASPEVGRDWEAFDNQFSLFIIQTYLYRSGAAHAGKQAVRERRETRGQMTSLSFTLDSLSESLFDRMHRELTGT